MEIYMSKNQEDLELDTIQRCPHDSENPYTMVLNALIRDQTISPNCRWLLTYLLSNEKGWKIKPRQIMNHLEKFMKKDSVYKIINEAIEAGYMMREEVRKNGKFAGNKYFISEIPKFKKSLPCLKKPDTVLSNPIRQTIKKEHVLKKKIAKEQQQKVADAPIVVSSIDEEREEQADAAATQFIKKERAKGNKVDETRVRRKALKEGWKPNEEDEDPKDLANKFVDELFYDGKDGMFFECQKNREGVGFLCGNHLYFAGWKSPTFAKDFKAILDKLGIK